MRHAFIVILLGWPVLSVTSPAQLPPIDTHCTADSDCGVTTRQQGGPLQCCLGCGNGTPGNKRWVNDFEKACTAYVASNHTSCPPLACPQGITQTVCAAGVCKLKI